MFLLLRSNIVGIKQKRFFGSAIAVQSEKHFLHLSQSQEKKMYISLDLVHHHS